MSTNTTPQPTPWWARLRDAVRYVLQLEPVAVQAVLRAVLVLAAAVGLTVPEWVEPRAAGVIVAFYALVELVTTLRARAKVVPQATVVEQAVDGQVVAGPASELATGTVVRDVGSLAAGGLYQ